MFFSFCYRYFKVADPQFNNSSKKAYLENTKGATYFFNLFFTFMYTVRGDLLSTLSDIGICLLLRVRFKQFLADLIISESVDYVKTIN